MRSLVGYAISCRAVVRHSGGLLGFIPTRTWLLTGSRIINLPDPSNFPHPRRPLHLRHAAAAATGFIGSFHGSPRFSIAQHRTNDFRVNATTAFCFDKPFACTGNASSPHRSETPSAGESLDHDRDIRLPQVGRAALLRRGRHHAENRGLGRKLEPAENVVELAEVDGDNSRRGDRHGMASGEVNERRPRYPTVARILSFGGTRLQLELSMYITETRLALLAVLSACVATALQAEDPKKEYREQDTGYLFPAKLGAWTRGPVKTYLPDPGVSIPYDLKSGGAATIFVYNEEPKPIPEGIASDVIKRHFAQVQKEVISIRELRGELVTKKESQEVWLGEPEKSPKSFLTTFTITEKGDRKLISHLYLFGRKGQFIKIRITYDQQDKDAATESEALVKELGKLMK